MKNDKSHTKTQSRKEGPVDEVSLALQVHAISDAVQKLAKSGLHRRAIVALIHDDTKISKRSIEEVMDSLESLKKKYTAF